MLKSLHECNLKNLTKLVEIMGFKTKTLARLGNLTRANLRAVNEKLTFDVIREYIPQQDLQRFTGVENVETPDQATGNLKKRAPINIDCLTYSLTENKNLVNMKGLVTAPNSGSKSFVQRKGDGPMDRLAILSQGAFNTEEMLKGLREKRLAGSENLFPEFGAGQILESSGTEKKKGGGGQAMSLKDFRTLNVRDAGSYQGQAQANNIEMIKECQLDMLNYS